MVCETKARISSEGISTKVVGRNWEMFALVLPDYTLLPGKSEEQKLVCFCVQ